VGKAQSLHFQQVFRTLGLMRFPQAKKCVHVSFDEVRLPTGKMSSRTGVNIIYEDLKEELLEFTLAETEARHKDWQKSKIKDTALQIAIASLKFKMLSQDNNKPIIFDPKKATSFEGDTGPYIQYAYARANSILKKGKLKLGSKIDYSLLDSPEELKLISSLESFPKVVDKCAREFRVSYLANYTIDLAQSFNEFYHNHKCIVDNKEISKARLTLVKSTKSVLGHSLKLLGLNALEEM